MGLIYLRLDNNQEGTQNRIGSLFFIVINQAMANIMGLLHTFPIEKPILIREVKSGLYGATPYFVARTILASLTVETIYPLAFGAITFFLVGFDVGQPNPISTFLWFELILVLSTSILGS